MYAAFLGFAWVAAMTWYYSSRPRAFLRRFVPRDEWLSVCREFRRPENCRAIRAMAVLQLTLGLVVGMVALLSGE
ncbi:MAG: hypothetical protein DCC68_10880 [Planctomycetota bacterium]|nr:MAG: hypothetical protein DCC68_10880 [Planctomycetota bacterium]